MAFSQTLTVPTTTGLHSFSVSQPGLTSFSLGAVDYQLDNVVYNLAVIPEPGSLALITAGLLGLGALWRRRAGAGFKCR